MLDLNERPSLTTALQALIDGRMFYEEQAIVKERCGNDATFIVVGRGIAILEHVVYGTAPGTLRTELEAVDVWVDGRTVEEILAFTIKFKAVDDEDYADLSFLNLTKLAASESLQDQVIALSVIHYSVINHLNDGEFDRHISLMQNLDQQIIAKLKE